MKKLIPFISLLFFLNCKTNEPKTIQKVAKSNHISPVSTLYSPLNYFETKELGNRPYKIKLNLLPLKNNEYDLEIQMILNKGSYYVSPNSKGNFKGIFTLSIDENNKLKRVSKLLETPLSIEEFDDHPFVNGYVNWVRQNTTYNQAIKRTSNDTFEVKGFIQFTIEPQCTLEKIPFVIKGSKDTMEVKMIGC